LTIEGKVATETAPKTPIIAAKIKLVFSKPNKLNSKPPSTGPKAFMTPIVILTKPRSSFLSFG